MEPAGTPFSDAGITCVRCGYNLTGSALGGTCPECGTPIQESLHPGLSGPPLPQLSYVGPVLVTVFCCLLSGIASLIYTSKANTAGGLGRVAEYESAKKYRNGWLLATVIGGLLIVLFQVLTSLGIVAS